MAYNHNDRRGVGHGGYPMSSSHANIKMKKSDKVWIQVHGKSDEYIEDRD